MIFPPNLKPDDVGSLLKAGNVVSSALEQNQVERTSCNLDENSDRFFVKDRNFGRQYAHIYAERLLTMRQKLSQASKDKWGADYPIRKLHELQSNEKCIVIGTLFKHMELKPSILKEISEDHNLMPQPVRTRYTDPSDKLIIEDELQRIFLVGGLKCETSVTGVIVAVLGTEPEDDKGKFHVEDHCFQNLPHQIPLTPLEEDKFILFVSGLDLGGKEERMFQMQMLADMITGQLGDFCQQSAAASICHVVVAGDSLSQSTQDRDSLTKAKYLTKKTSAGSIEAIKSLDNFFMQLLPSVDVTIMPGEFDPTNHVLPQQPLHRCMFPQSAKYSTFHCRTNPCDVTLEGRRILGTAGQPISDIMKYSDLDNPLEVLENTLLWGHIAPTAPDTLGCYPFVKEDPFILTDCPHIFFTGCQKDFGSKIYKGPSKQEILLLTVPRFSQSGMVALVNLRSLEVQPLSFHGHFPTKDESVSPDVDK